MLDENAKREEINKFARVILDYIESKPESLSELKYPRITNDTKECIVDNEYKLDHPLRKRFASKMNEINYETLCDIACNMAKCVGKLPENIHKRILLGKTNVYVKEYVSLIS